MTASWVAGTVRATDLARHRLEPADVRRLAAEQTLAAAITRLAGTPYRRHVVAGQSLAEAQHAVAATLLWHVRVLAGWVPPHGARVLRGLAAGFEVANVDEHLRRLDGRPAESSYAMGALATAWPRLARTRTPEQLHRVLATTPWGPPGSASPRDVHLSMTLAWAERVVHDVPVAAEWGRAAAALTVLREVLLGQEPLEDGAVVGRLRRLLGPAFSVAVTGPGSARDLATATRLVPAQARGLWEEVREPADLWRAEASLVHLLQVAGLAGVRRRGHGPENVVCAVALLAVDAWRVRAALAIAAMRENAPTGVALSEASEVLDALA
jgi:hypothetical protein